MPRGGVEAVFLHTPWPPGASESRRALHEGLTSQLLECIIQSVMPACRHSVIACSTHALGFGISPVPRSCGD
eukprot:13406635-Alexandrium_andersonii.AAC.1